MTILLAITLFTLKTAVATPMTAPIGENQRISVCINDNRLEFSGYDEKDKDLIAYRLNEIKNTPAIEDGTVQLPATGGKKWQILARTRTNVCGLPMYMLASVTPSVEAIKDQNPADRWGNQMHVVNFPPNFNVRELLEDAKKAKPTATYHYLDIRINGLKYSLSCSLQDSAPQDLYQIQDRGAIRHSGARQGPRADVVLSATPIIEPKVVETLSAQIRARYVQKGDKLIESLKDIKDKESIARVEICRPFMTEKQKTQLDALKAGKLVNVKGTGPGAK